MKCPRCNLENPSGIRYCLRCGSPLTPPIPRGPESRRNHKADQNIFRMVILALIAIVVIATLILTTIDLFIGSARSSVSYPETVQDNIASEEEVPEYVDFSHCILTIPGSNIEIVFPEFIDYFYDFNEETGRLLFEITTADDLTITFSSSILNTPPYTKSEAEASQQQNELFYAIEGTENEYYYILPSDLATTYGTIIDAYSNRLVNITVVDHNYVSEDSEESYDSEEMNEFSDETPEMTDENEEMPSEDQTDENSDLEEPDIPKSSLSPSSQISNHSIQVLQEIMKSTGIES